MILPLGTAGLVKSDLSLRFYRNGISDAVSLAAITVTDLGNGDYRVDSLPFAGAGEWFTLTWEYPAGVGGAYTYPNSAVSSPPSLVLPVRETGLTATDFAFSLYLNGIAQSTSSLVATELVTGGGDYAITGLPSTVGNYVLVYTRFGISYSLPWDIRPASTFAAEFADLMPDTVIVTSGYLNSYGDFITSGAILSLPCRIEGTSKLVRDRAGQEVVSSFQIYTDSFNTLSVDRHRFTLPSRFTPRTEVQAIGIDPESDETGPCYEVIYLP